MGGKVGHRGSPGGRSSWEISSAGSGTGDGWPLVMRTET